jgi:hypothetical protein
VEGENYKTELTLHIPLKVFYTVYNLLSLAVGVKNGQAHISRMLCELLRNTLSEGAGGEAAINSTVQQSMEHITTLLACIGKIPRQVLTSPNIDICLRFSPEEGGTNLQSYGQHGSPFDGLDFGDLPFGE